MSYPYFQPNTPVGHSQVLRSNGFSEFDSSKYSATYTCEFHNLWDETKHPFNFPSNAHWSPPVIVAHNNKYKMWKTGKLASDGVKEVAETGGTGTIMDEIESAREESFVGESVQGAVQYNSESSYQTFTEITLTPWFNQMSSITMVSPSPDWFTGLSALKPKGPKNWLDSFDAITYPFDAGTDAGITYNAANKAEDPPLAIQELTVDTIPIIVDFTSNGPVVNQAFLNSDLTGVEPVAVWKCTLTAISCVDHDKVKQRGKAKRNCKWAGKPKNPEKRNKRCKKKFKGKAMSVWCPLQCGQCSVEEAQQFSSTKILM